MELQQKQQLLHRAEHALDSIRPHLAVDKGNVEIVEITDDFTLKIKWLGMCEGCSMSAMTLRAGIQQAVRGEVPEILLVEPVN